MPRHFNLYYVYALAHEIMQFHTTLTLQNASDAFYYYVLEAREILYFI